MKRRLSRKSICLAATALVLAAGVSVGGAMAYFTSYATASGTVKLSLAPTTTEVHEDFDSWTKHITIENTGDTDAFIRVKAFAGSECVLSYPGIASGKDAGWRIAGDDAGSYVEYTEVVPAGATTGNLDLLISPADAAGFTADEFNVIVIQESTPVSYDKDGNAFADWTKVVSSSQEEYTAEEGEE